MDQKTLESDLQLKIEILDAIGRREVPSTTAMFDVFLRVVPRSAGSVQKYCKPRCLRKVPTEVCVNETICYNPILLGWFIGILVSDL